MTGEWDSSDHRVGQVSDGQVVVESVYPGGSKLLVVVDHGRVNKDTDENADCQNPSTCFASDCFPVFIQHRSRFVPLSDYQATIG